MLKLLATGQDGKRLLIFGIDNGNIRRLRKKQPISVDVDTLIPGTNLRFVIAWGRTLRDLENEFAPYITMRTKVHVDPTTEQIMDGEAEDKVDYSSYSDEQLDEVVHEFKSMEAADINNAGREAQLEYLRNGGP